MRFFFLLIFMFCAMNISAQSKRDHNWIIGLFRNYAKFDGTNNRPKTGIWGDSNTIFSRFFFGHSIISDSISGAPLFYGNEGILFDSSHNIMDNGDHLCDSVLYNRNGGPGGNMGKQATLCLPKKGNEYYFISLSSSDSVIQNVWYNSTVGNVLGAYADRLEYNIIDMSTNNGLGKVIRRRVPALEGVRMCKQGMQACLHANGRDWWVLKQAMDSNKVYKLLFTPDSVYDMGLQILDNKRWGVVDYGQANFNLDGSKYAFTQTANMDIMVCDFNRCNGQLSNIVYHKMQEYGTYGEQNDSSQTGIAFSPNGRFVYTSRLFYIDQLDLLEQDTSKQWALIWSGPDTSLLAFDEYNGLQNGPDGRIYIGKYGGTKNFLSVIDSPDNKGAAASFCPKCLRIDTIAPQIGGNALANPPNMPNYNMGAQATACWPQSVTNEAVNEIIKIYPNPARDAISIEFDNAANNYLEKRVKLTNITGEQVMAVSGVPINKKLTIKVSHLASGIYFLAVDSQVFKVFVE
jgi:hypothetical protein